MREKAVGMQPLITAGNFDDEVASGKAAGEADGARLGGFGAAGNETEDFFEEWNGALDALGELDFEFGGDAVAGSLLGLIGNGGDDGRMGVAEQHGAPGPDKIEQLVAVGVKKRNWPAPRSMMSGSPPTETESADGAVDAADEDAFSVGEDFAGTPAAAVLRGVGWEAVIGCIPCFVRNRIPEKTELRWFICSLPSPGRSSAAPLRRNISSQRYGLALLMTFLPPNASSVAKPGRSSAARPTKKISRRRKSLFEPAGGSLWHDTTK